MCPETTVTGASSGQSHRALAETETITAGTEHGCDRCALDTYSADGTSYGSYHLARCNRCPPSLSTNSYSSMSESDCNYCKKGFYSNDGTGSASSPCTACASGFTTKEDYGAFGTDPCTICAQGYYNPDDPTGQPPTACVACDTGLTTEGAGVNLSSSCSICERGYYSVDGTNSNEECKICPDLTTTASAYTHYASEYGEGVLSTNNPDNKDGTYRGFLLANVYENVKLLPTSTSSFASGAKAEVTVYDRKVHSIVITDAGSGYTSGTDIYIDHEDIGYSKVGNHFTMSLSADLSTGPIDLTSVMFYSPDDLGVIEFAYIHANVTSGSLSWITAKSAGNGYKEGDKLKIFGSSLGGGGDVILTLNANVMDSGGLGLKTDNNALFGAVTELPSDNLSAPYKNVPIRTRTIKYEDISFTGGTGTGGKVTVGVNQGTVVSVQLTTPGSNYAQNDVITIQHEDIGTSASSTNLQLELSALYEDAYISLSVTSTNIQIPTDLTYNADGAKATVTISNKKVTTITVDSGFSGSGYKAGYEVLLPRYFLGQSYYYVPVYDINNHYVQNDPTATGAYADVIIDPANNHIVSAIIVAVGDGGYVSGKEISIHGSDIGGDSGDDLTRALPSNLAIGDDIMKMQATSGHHNTPSVSDAHLGGNDVIFTLTDGDIVDGGLVSTPDALLHEIRSVYNPTPCDRCIAGYYGMKYPLSDSSSALGSGSNIELMNGLPANTAGLSLKDDPSMRNELLQCIRDGNDPFLPTDDTVHSNLQVNCDSGQDAVVKLKVSGNRISWIRVYELNYGHSFTA
eukprot:GSChrysophyteH1.ASY1.ANO1.1966.1 assembled CDS